MSNKVTEATEELVLPILQQKELELVDIQYKKEGSNWFLRVFIDKEGGVDLEDCSEVSEVLSTELDKHDPIPQAYFLEVSSPGAERPLKNKKDFEEALGKMVALGTYAPIDGQKHIEGKLVDVKNDLLTIDYKVKTKRKQIQIPLEKIASARLAISF